MSLAFRLPIRCTLLLFSSTFLISACSSSGDSGVAGTQSSANVITENEEPETDSPETLNDPVITTSGATETPLNVPGTTTETETQTGRIVTWDITVPVHFSDKLQLTLIWNGQEMPTQWVSGQSWSATGFVPLQDRQPISITFYDRNGDITLGSYEGFYAYHPSYYTHGRTIRADQFATDRYDDDSDGISNIDELRAGTNPLVHVDAEQSSVDLSTVYTEVFDLLAGYQFDQLDLVVQDLVRVIGQETTIIWPDGNYYQVQERDSLASICDGGAECQLLPGEYTVINHTTNEPYPLDVSTTSPADNPNATLLEDGAFVIEDEIFTTETAPVERIQYACENGGAVTTEIVDANPVRRVLAGTTYVGEFDRIKYRFDQCRLTLRDGPLPDGTYLINGMQINEFKDYYGWRDTRQLYKFEAFSITGDNGLEYKAEGEVTDFHLGTGDFSYSRRVNIVEYTMQPGGRQVGQSMTDVRYSFDSDFGRHPAFLKHRQEMSGSLRHAKTGGNAVTVSTPSVLNAYLELNEDPTPFQGLVEMRTEDGGVLHLGADSVEAPERWSLYVAIDYTAADGEQTSLRGIPFERPDIYGPDCEIVRVEGVRRLVCT